MDLLPSLPNLPALLPGETLYSWAGYAHARNAVLDPRELSRRLYGAPYAALLHDFPAHLDVLDARLDGALGSPRDLALRRTLLGYFLPPLIEQSAAVLLSRTRTSAYSTIKFKLGIPASRVGGSHPLKACCSCIAADEAEFGRAYWHIEHQFPSALVCVKHQRMLRFISNRITPVHQRGWFLPTLGLPREWVEPPEPAAQQFDVLLTLAAHSHAWAKLDPASLDGEHLAQAYQSALRDQGWATARGSLRLAGLTRAVQSHFQGLNSFPGLASLSSIRDDWPGLVGTLARATPRSGHPLKHLLLIAMLFPDWPAFQRAYRQATASGREAPPSEIDSDVQSSEQMTRFAALVRDGRSLTGAAKEVGVTTATGVRWAKVLGLSFTSRAKTLTPPILEAVRDRLRAGATKEAVCSACSISLVSLNRLISSEPEVAEQWRRARLSIALDTNRAQFLRAIQDHPGWTVKQLRELRGNGYMWLYRNDREWLLQNLPSMWNAVTPLSP